MKHDALSHEAGHADRRSMIADLSLQGPGLCDVGKTTKRHGWRFEMVRALCVLLSMTLPIENTSPVAC
jgi:hypothetical protein